MKNLIVKEVAIYAATALMYDKSLNKKKRKRLKKGIALLIEKVESS